MTRLALAAVVLVLAAGCGDDGGRPVDGETSRQELTRQRIDVRAAGHDLLAALERRLSGSTRTGSGQYRGCEGAFNDQYGSFQYLAQGRVDTGGPVSEADLEAVLEAEGFTAARPSDGPGGQRMLRATKEGITAVLTAVDDQPYVLLDVSGPCIDVPEDQRDDWLNADEPSPDLR